MDFDPVLARVHGALLKANNAKPLLNLRSKGGNEVEIQKVVDIVSDAISGKGSACDSIIVEAYRHTLRRINFFLILNTDLDVLEELVNHDDIGHLIWVTPMIPKCLLIHLVWGLDFHEFYCEAIKYCHPVLSLEILGIATDNMKYSTPEESVKRVTPLVSSAYEMIIRMSQRAVKVSDQKAILRGAFDKISELLKYFSDPPNKLKMSNWTVDQLYLHAGNAMLNFLQHSIYCFKLFLDNPQEMSKDCEIYLGTFDDSSVEISSEKQDNIDDIVTEYISKLNDLLLEALKQNVMMINLDIYCSWSEHQESKDSGKSLQKAVGELAYELCAILNSDSRFENEVISMLPEISHKPEDLSDLIQRADMETTVQRASQVSEDQEVWMSALLKENHFFSDERCIQCASNNINVISTEDRKTIFKSVVNLLYDPVKCECSDSIKNLALKCLSTLSPDDQVSLITKSFASHELGDVLEMPDYDQKLTEFLNKLLEITDSTLSELYSLFIQNPVKFYERTFSECIDNTQQTSVMLNALQRLKVFIDIKVKLDVDPAQCTFQNETLSGVRLLILHTVRGINVENMKTYVEELSYVYFIKGIIETDLLNDELVLLKVLMPAIHRYLTEKNCPCLLLYLQALKEVFCTSKHAKYIAPLLVMIAQIMECVRWDLATFTAAAADVLHSSIVFQKSILQTFLQLKQPSDSEFKWLSGRLTFLSPMNAYYFQELWPQQFFKELYDTSLKAEDSMICLCHLLPRSTIAEWKKIFSGMTLQNDVSSSFVTLCSVFKWITKSCDELKSEQAYSCLEHCCRNVASILQDIIVSKESNAEKLLLIKNVVSLVNSVPPRMHQACFTCFLSPLSHLITAYVDLHKSSDPEVKVLTDAIDESDYEEFKSVLRHVVSQHLK